MPANDHGSNFGFEADSGRSASGQAADGRSRVGAPVKTASDPFVDTMLADRYHILGVIGQGGMGVVYKARQELLDRLVAIKMLKTQLITDESSVKRFRHEAKAASRLNHRNVITVYDFGVANSGEPYIVMEFLEGLSLSDAISKGRALKVDRALNVFDQVCDALEHAHSQGMIHRDLKPANIMLSSSTASQMEIKVVDFGIAKLVAGTPSESQKLTQTGEIFGSPVYMSPEQCRGEELGPASDVYAMGVVMYETLTGRVPFMGSNIVETITQHLCAPPPSMSQVRPDLEIPESIECIVMKCLRKEPSVRYRSMAELKYDILQQCGPETWRRQSTRLTSEFTQTSRDLTDQPSSPAGAEEYGNQPRPATKRRTSELAPPSPRRSGEFTQAQRRSSSVRSLSHDSDQAGQHRASTTPYFEPSQQHGQIVYILAGLVALLVAITGAIIWAAMNGYFSKVHIQSPAAPVPQPPAVHMPSTTPVTSQPPPINSSANQTAASKVPAASAKQASNRPRNSNKPPENKPSSKRQPRTSGTTTAEPAITQPSEEPIVPTRHRYHGDDYSRWSDFRQLERGQSKIPPL